MKLMLLAGVVMLLCFFAVDLAIRTYRHHEPPCTHGESSIGPVTILKDGRVNGSTVPRTSGCVR